MNSDVSTGRPGDGEAIREASGGRSEAPPVPLAPLLRPMEIGELLDEAFDLYRRNFRLFFGIAILLDLPSALFVLTTPEESTSRLIANLISGFCGIVTIAALTAAAAERAL